MHGQLNTIRGPELQALLSLPWRAVFVIHGGNQSLRCLDEVHLRDNAMLLARQSYRAGVNLLGCRHFGFRQFGRFCVDALVLDFALDCIDALSKQPFHPFIKEQARAIDEFVDHPRGKIVRQTIAHRGLTPVKIGGLRRQRIIGQGSHRFSRPP